ncbi:MAG: hypothetical protein WD059_08720 [Balneolaceae bacterium]
MKNKILLLTLFLAVLILGFVYVGWLFGPGAFPRAEFYEFDVQEDSLISIIESVKQENPEFILPKSIKMPDGDYIELKDGRRDSTSHWHKIYFYYPDKKQILLTWTRPTFTGKTTFAFASINSFKKEWRWKPPNENFWWWKNQDDIDEFEHRILQKINTQLNSNK